MSNNNEYINQGMTLNAMRQAILPKSLNQKGGIYIFNNSSIDILPPGENDQFLIADNNSPTGLSYTSSLNGNYISYITPNHLVGDEGSAKKVLLSAANSAAVWGTIIPNFEDNSIHGIKLNNILDHFTGRIFDLRSIKYIKNSGNYWRPAKAANANVNFTTDVTPEFLKFDLSGGNHCLTITNNYLSNDFNNFQMNRIVEGLDSSMAYYARIFFSKTFNPETVTNFPGDPSDLKCTATLQVPDINTNALITIMSDSKQFSADDNYIMFGIAAMWVDLIQNAINNNLDCVLKIYISRNGTDDIIQQYTDTIKIALVPEVALTIVAAVPIGTDMRVGGFVQREEGCSSDYSFEGHCTLYCYSTYYGTCRWSLGDFTLNDYETHDFYIDFTGTNAEKLNHCIYTEHCHFYAVMSGVMSKSGEIYNKLFEYDLGQL